MLQACREEKARYDLRNLEETEVYRIVFAGASVSEFRGISDAFTVDELLIIANSDSYSAFPQSLKDWIWQGITNEEKHHDFSNGKQYSN